MPESRSLRCFFIYLIDIQCLIESFRRIFNGTQNAFCLRKVVKLWYPKHVSPSESGKIVVPKTRFAFGKT